MGERYAGIARRTERRRDAGDNDAFNAVGCERLDLFPAAAENEGVAAFQAHH